MRTFLFSMNVSRGSHSCFRIPLPERRPQSMDSLALKGGTTLRAHNRKLIEALGQMDSEHTGRGSSLS